MDGKWKPIEQLVDDVRIADLIEIRSESSVQACTTYHGEDEIVGYFVSSNNGGIILNGNRRSTLLSEEEGIFVVGDSLISGGKYRVISRYAPSSGNGLDKVFCSFSGIEIPDEEND